MTISIPANPPAFLIACCVFLLAAVAFTRYQAARERRAELEAEEFVSTVEATPESTIIPAVESHGLVPMPLPRRKVNDHHRV